MGKSGRIAFGIVMLSVLLLVNGAGAQNIISSCSTISSPGDYVLNQSIVNSPDSTCISITSNDVTLDGAGYTIDGTNTLYTYGINVHNISMTLTNVTVKNLRVTDWNNGIYYLNTTGGQIANNSANSNVNSGIYLAYSSYLNLSNNSASTNYIGFVESYSNNNTLYKNNASSNYAIGFHLDHTNNSMLSGNDANWNGNSSILMISSDGNKLSGNRASDNGNGIFLISSSKNMITASEFSKNYNGIYLASSGNNDIHDNLFNNSNNFLIVSSENTWNTTNTSGKNIAGGPYLGGNFWANPNGTGFSQTCTDGNKDGICDSPYMLDINNTDYLPLTYNPGTPVQSTTGKGIVYFSADAGTIENLTAVNVSEIPQAPPSNANLPYGLFTFNITNVPVGGSVTMTLTFPEPLPPGTIYWKFGANLTNPTPHWYTVPSTINGNKLTLTLTDGGNGDDDLTANGRIKDPGGPATNTSEIRGMKWDDSNGNAIRDPGEPGVANVTICYYGYGVLTNCTITNESGSYRIADLYAGIYAIYEIPPQGKVQTYPNVPDYSFNFSLRDGALPHFVKLNASEIKEGIDFGNANASEIHGMKFNDSNGNGVRDIDESVVPGMGILLIRMISPGNEYQLDYTVTDVNGNYSFMNLSPSYYKVEEDLLYTAMSQTYPANGSPHIINLGLGEVRTGVDFGNQPVPGGEVRGIKFNDSNGNRVQDPGEQGVPGVNICLWPTTRCENTDFSGNYSFMYVPAGTYTVYEYLPAGSIATTPAMVTATVNSNQVVTVNFGNRMPTPPPQDVSVVQQSGTQNGVPTVLRPGLTNLTIRKNLTNISNVVAVNLTLNWSDGTTKSANMTRIDATDVWEANISSPFPPGTAQMTFIVDVYPAGPGPEDAIQIGDIMFIDPSGTISDACTNAPISGATVTLLVEYPPTTGIFVPSPPENQIPTDNPQVTGDDGKYSWMTLPGWYMVRAEKAGYTPADSPAVEVPPPKFDLNISLTPTSGCPVPAPAGNVTGEGWIRSPVTPQPKNNNKATFDFTARFADGSAIPGGSLQYNDHAAGLKVNGNVTALSADMATNTAIFSGTAKITDATGTITGTYTVTAVDNGEPGTGKDTFNIIVSTGYAAGGTLGGGDIQLHDP